MHVRSAWARAHDTEPLAIASFHAQFREAFPDIEVVVEDQIAEGDTVATRCSVRGKHTGDSLGFAATQAPVEFTGVTITRIKDGKIIETWNNFDFMKMYKQVGSDLTRGYRALISFDPFTAS